MSGNMMKHIFLSIKVSCFKQIFNEIVENISIDKLKSTNSTLPNVEDLGSMKYFPFHQINLVTKYEWGWFVCKDVETSFQEIGDRICRNVSLVVGKT